MILYQQGGPTNAALNAQQPYIGGGMNPITAVPDIFNQYNKPVNLDPTYVGPSAPQQNTAQLYITPEKMNPNKAWMAEGATGSAALQKANFHNTLIGTVIPIPGLNQIKGAGALSKTGIIDAVLKRIFKSGAAPSKQIAETGANYLVSNESTGAGWINTATKALTP